MNIRVFRAALALASLALLVLPLAALAHEEITVGDYVIEYGWQDEPPTAGQPNAIVLNFSAAEEQSGQVSGEVSILAPADGSTINGDSLLVAISVEGIDAHDQESLHWHLYVDDRVVTMAPLTQTSLTVTGLTNGPHTLQASMAGTDHAEFGEPALVSVTVSGSSATGLPSVSGVEPMAGHTEGVEVDVSGLTVELVYGGQTTALALEPLPGGEPGQFKADFTPERPGKYTLALGGQLSGSMGAAEADVEVEPEEVLPGATPPGATPSQSSALPLIVIGAIVAAVSAFAVWFFVARSKK